MANFDKLLEASVQDIKRSVNTKYDQTLTEEKAKYYNKEQHSQYADMIDKVQMQIDELQKKKRELEDAKDKLIPDMSFEWKEWCSENGYHVGYGNRTEPAYLARKALHDQPVYRNIAEFDALSNKYINAMNIAVGTKEKRAILMSFYNLDWKSLWIDVPPEMNFNEVEIKDGKIISDTSKLLSN